MPNFYKRVLIISLPLLSIFFPFLTSKAQTVLLTDGFETGLQTNNWTTVNYTANSGNWIQYFYSQNTGTYSAAYFPNNQNANSWLFTKALPFTQGKYYQIKYYAKVDNNTSFQTTLSTSTTFSAPKTTIRNNYVASYPFNLVIDTIVAESTNNYYIGFQNYSAASPSGTSSLIDDVEITELNLPMCTVVNAGTISSNVTNSCPNNPFTLTSASTTINTQGIKYSWQKSTDNLTWINITNGYTYQKNITLTQTQPTYYRHVDTCATSGLTSISNVIQITNTSYLNCYCTPSPINCFGSQTFTNIKINNGVINNTSTCIANGNGNYTALPAATTFRNQNVVIQTTIANPNSLSYYVGIWIDYDQNSVFDQNEFTINGPYTNLVNTSQITIPNTALLGQTRIRIQAKAYFSAYPLPYEYTEACTGTGQTGETEDYLLNIATAPNCTGAVAAGNIAASVTQICPNNNFTITATGTTTNAAQMRYAWQQSTDNVNWTNLNNTGYLINPLNISQNNTSFYRLVDTCLASGTSSISNAINVTATNLFNCYCAPNNAVCSTIGIDTVRFNTINNGSPTCPTGGYSNFTTLSTTINNGSYVPIYLRLKNNTTLKYVDVYIDFNRNGTFTADEKAFNGVGTNVIAGNVNIPFNVVAGATLMRIIASNSSFNSPCINSFTIGETEDYTVNLNMASPATNHFCFYVNKIATGLNNGTSWTNAFTSLAQAFSFLNKADTIKVAQGIYTPGNSANNTFTLKDSVIILGGYPNVGSPTDAQRNFSQYQTIMSGEIGIANSLSDNTTKILTTFNTKGSVVDGFIIEKGYDNIYNSEGPISYNTTTGTLQNMVVRNNYNGTTGAGINITKSSITLTNCFFEKDSSSAYYTNTASIINIRNLSTVNIYNSVIAKNISQYTINVDNSKLKIVNSTIFKNYGFCNFHDTSNVQIQNSISYNNGYLFSRDTADFLKDVYTALNIQNSISEIYTHANYNGREPKFIDTSKLAGADNFYFTTDDGLSLLNPCSPAINTGNNVFANFANDITGSPRIKNGVVDMGAYEVQPPITAQPNVLYVNKNATGLNNGLSWANAFTDLQAAFYSCSDTIKVAMGNYSPSTTDENSNFRLTNNRVVIGGYPNIGNPSNSQINPALYPTRFDGYINANLKSNCVLTSVNNDSTAKVINFEIINTRDQLFNNMYFPNGAALKIINYSNPSFENLTLNTFSNWSSNLITIDNASKPLFYSCKFYNTKNVIPSGVTNPIGVVITKNCSPKFVKSYFGRDTILNASGQIDGGIVRTTDSENKFDSCSFYNSLGGSIQNINSTSNIFNCNFIKVNGRCIDNDSSVVNIFRCNFKDSSTTTFGGYSSGDNLIVNFNNSNVVVNKCKFLNTGGGICASTNSITNFKNCALKNARGGIGGFSVNGGQLKLINSVSYDGAYNTYNACCFSNHFLAAINGADIQIINSTIVSNSNVTNANNINCNTNATMKFYNSIIWKYGSGLTYQTAENDINTDNNNSTAFLDVRNSFLFKQGNSITTNSQIGKDPKLFDLSNLEGPDGDFFTNDDALRLCSCSPAINFGNNSLNPEIIDLVGNPRVFNNSIDAGAYELQQTNTTNKTYFVKETAPANGNGTSWAVAYNKLQTAVLNNCADTIKIAAGTYKAANANRDSSFNIYRGLTLLGGYPASGTPTDADRNPNLYQSIISGDIGTQNDSTDNTKTVVFVHCPDTTVVIDGLTIEKGNGEDITTPQLSSGGGIKLVGNFKTIINNCKIRRNYAYQGGGIFTNNTPLTINKTVIENNNAYSGGGFWQSDFYFVLNNQPYQVFLDFKNSVLSGNKGGAITVSGRGFYNNNNFSNLIIYNNEGGHPGFYMPDNAFVNITNCLFAKNNKTYYYPGIDINVSSPFYGNNLNTFVNNSIFRESTIFGGPSYYANDNLNWQINTTSAEPIPYGHLNNTIISSGAQTTGGSGGNNTVTFRDYNNPLGPDGLWMSADDGLQVTACSDNIDHGSNLYVQNIPTDILGTNRIINTTVDIGPYEAVGIPPISPTAIITASDTTICAGTTIQFFPTVTGGTNNTVYQWKRNGVNVGTNQPFYSANNFADGDVVKVDIIINNPCVTVQTITSNSITIHVNTSLTGTVSIASSANPSCVGNNITFTSTATNVGTNPTYQWKVNGTNAGSNLPTFTTSSLINNDIVSLRLTSNLSCITNSPILSNSITQVLNSSSAVPTVTISTLSTSVCSGTSITFNAVTTNAGTSPTYQWQVNGVNVGTNSNVFTTNSLTNNALVECMLTSNAACITTQTANSNVLTITVISTLTPSVSINTTSSTICNGSSNTFTANATNGGGAPIYQWQINGVNVGTNSPTFTSSTLNNNDQIKCLLTSNALCAVTTNATSNVITMVVTAAVTPTVSIASSSTMLCSGTSVTFTATPTNGGPTPTYQWKVNNVNAGTNSPTFTTSSLQNNDQVSVVMTSSLACAAPTTATSNAITMVVTTSPLANAGNDVSICVGSSTQLTGSGGSSYSWSPTTGLSNANIANPIATPSTSTFYVLTVSNGSCTSLDTVRVIVQQITTPTVSISTASNNICSGSNVTFTAAALNAGANPSYQWQVNGINVGTNSATFSSYSLPNNAQVKVIVTSNGCTTTPTVTSNIITMSVRALAQPLVSLNANVLTVTNADAAAVYTWQVLTNTIWGNVTPSATGITYTITQPGEYRVKAEKAACTLYSASQVSARTNSLDSTLYYIYLNPNPARGLVTVYKIVPSQKWTSLDIMSLQGQRVLPTKDIRGLRTVPISVGTLAPGLYFVRLTNEDGRKLSYKFIKE